MFDALTFIVDTTRLLKALRTNEIDFEAFKSEYLMKKDFVNQYALLLAESSKRGNVATQYKIGGRDVVVTYLFCFFNFADELKQVSSNLIEAWCQPGLARNDTQAWKLLDMCLTDYQVAYHHWKHHDKQILLKELTELYWEFELIHHLNPDLPVNDLLAKSEKQNAIIARMMKIDDLDYFYQYQPIVFSPDAVQYIHDTLKDAFWDSVKNDLPDITTVLKIFDDIRSMLEYILPLDGRMANVLTNFDETIDIEYIKQLHAVGATDMDFWVRKCEYLTSVIIPLDSVDAERYYNERLQQLKTSPSFDGAVDFLAEYMEKMKYLFDIQWTIRSHPDYPNAPHDSSTLPV